MLSANRGLLLYGEVSVMSNGSPDILFTRLLYYTKWLEKGDNSVKYLQNFAKS